MGGGGRSWLFRERDSAGRWVADKKRNRRPSRRKVYDSLARHENFEFPEAPQDHSAAALIDYAIEAAARLISPPKVPHEDEDFACEDIAAALRTRLRSEIYNRLGLESA